MQYVGGLNEKFQECPHSRSHLSDTIMYECIGLFRDCVDLGWHKEICHTDAKPYNAPQILSNRQEQSQRPIGMWF